MAAAARTSGTAASWRSTPSTPSIGSTASTPAAAPSLSSSATRTTAAAHLRSRGRHPRPTQADGLWTLSLTVADIRFTEIFVRLGRRPRPTLPGRRRLCEPDLPSSWPGSTSGGDCLSPKQPMPAERRAAPRPRRRGMDSGHLLADRHGVDAVVDGWLGPFGNPRTSTSRRRIGRGQGSTTGSEDHQDQLRRAARRTLGAAGAGGSHSRRRRRQRPRERLPHRDRCRAPAAAHHGRPDRRRGRHSASAARCRPERQLLRGASVHRPRLPGSMPSSPPSRRSVPPPRPRADPCAVRGQPSRARAVPDFPPHSD